MDIISGLPDDMLIKILTFVPTKVAVSTSILSKRWEYLCMWLPKLNYDGFGCSLFECERLRCFLDMNLPLHRAPVIESFRLELDNSLESVSARFKPPESIKMWVAIAVSHCLRELEILYKSDPDKSKILPSNLYTCKSLVILKLDGDILLDVPRMVSLPSLKTLELRGVTYFKDETLQRLLSNCPILEDLLVYLCTIGSTEMLTVVVPSLQSLSLHIPRDHEIEGYVIETPFLKIIQFWDYNNNDHYGLIENMPYLNEAYVGCCCPDINSLIGSIASVKKRLTICSEAIFDGLVFNQLEYLEVCLCAVFFPNQLVWLLNASSKLKRLDITLMDGHAPYQDLDYWKEPSTVPECLLSSLQSFSWWAYTGEPQERAIVSYILKHAVYLKTATITSSDCRFSKSKMSQELELSSRASTTCQLMFY